MLILGASSSFPPFSSSSPCQLFCFSFLVSSIWNAVKWSDLKWSEVKWCFHFIYDGIYKYPYRDFLYERLPSTSAPWSWLDLLIDPRELQRFFSLSHFFFIPPLSETGNKHECCRSTLSFLVRSIKACPWMRRRPPFSIILRRGSISLSERQASFCRKSASFSRTSRLISM